MPAANILRCTVVFPAEPECFADAPLQALHSFLWLKQHDEVTAETLPHFVKHGIKALKSPRHSHHELFTGNDRITIVLVEISQWSRWQFELMEKVVRSVSSRPGKM